MNKRIQGKVFVLGDNCDTDQIIPAHHLVYKLDDKTESKLYGKYALSGVPFSQSGLPNGKIPFVADNTTTSVFSIIIAGKNFGCGSSREHAPFALAKAGVKAVISEFYARIFYRNTIDGGFLIPFESQQRLIDLFSTGDQADIDVNALTITNQTTSQIYTLFSLGDVQGILEAGNIFEYAKQQGMM